MPTLHKQSCPTCGQSVNERQIALFSGMVRALVSVWKHCNEKNRFEFERKEVKHLFKNENEVARFGDWVLFGGLIYKHQKGHYGFNRERTSEFLAGRLEIPTTLWKNPLTKEIRKEDYKKIHQIKNLKDFLDQNQEFITQYREPTIMDYK